MRELLANSAHSPRHADDVRFYLGVVTGILAWAQCLGGPTTAYAQRFEEGDKIEVLFLGEWRPGTVVEVDRRSRVLAEFEFAGGVQRRPFPASEVRWVFEAGALCRPRTWTDTSGKFKTRAVLMAVDEEKVTLRKPDMSELEVPLSKLSDEDRQFVKRLQQKGVSAAGPTAPQGIALPPVEQFDAGDDSGSFAAFGEASPQRAALEPDPLPGYLALKQGGVGFPMNDIFDRVGALLPVGGENILLLAAVENQNPSAPTPTRLKWASLKDKKVVAEQLLAPGELVLDYHPPSHRLLTISSRSGAFMMQQEPIALAVWEVSTEDKTLKPIARWQSDTGATGPNLDPWARLVDGDTVIHRWSDHELVAWSIKDKRLKYRISQEAFFASPPTLSGGRRYLVIPEDEHIRILESSSGKPVSILPTSDGATGVAISEDGRNLAVLGRSTISVWDLTSATSDPQKCPSNGIANAFRATLAWVNGDQLMIESDPLTLVLFSLKRQMVIWNYRLDPRALRDIGVSRAREIVNGHLVYTASAMNLQQNSMVVGAVSLPGPKVAESEAAMNAEELMALKSGTHVRLDVRAGNDTPRVQQVLTAKIAANGWVLDAASPIVMIAEMTRGSTQNVAYRPSDAGFRRDADQSVSVTPFVSTLRIEVSQALAWQDGTSTGPPPVIQLEQGQTAQSEVDRWQNPNVEFFDYVAIPPRILDPKYRNGLGTTDVDTRGLVPR